MTTDVIPETCAEALAAWDRGESVVSAEMGGIGPGYEQIIQILAFECVRFLLDVDLPPVADTAGNDQVYEKLKSIVSYYNRELGLGCTGSQADCAMNIAVVTKRKGWRGALLALPGDRRIVVRKDFP